VTSLDCKRVDNDVIERRCVTVKGVKGVSSSSKLRYQLTVITYICF
jgi:hypothetical protein